MTHGASTKGRTVSSTGTGYKDACGHLVRRIAISARMVEAGTAEWVSTDAHKVENGIDEPTGALTTVYRALQRELIARSFEVDNRPFSPHLTLARVKSPLRAEDQQQLQRLLSKEQSNRFTSKLYIAHSLYIVKSELLQAGAQYTVLQECRFSL